MGVQAPPPYLVSARLGHYGLAEACQQRSYHQYAAPERSAFAYKLVALQIVEVDVLCLERIFVPAYAGYIHAYVCEQQNEILYVKNVRYVLYSYFFGRKQ